MPKDSKNSLNLEHLAALAKLATYPEWEVLKFVMSNRVHKDKNSIVTYPETEPVKLATMKAFYRGRISAMNLIKREVEGAGDLLEKEETKEDEPKKVKKSKK